AAPWPDTGRPRRAGVSSFGVSGTNAHVLVEQAPPTDPSPGPAAGSATAAPVPWTVSAHDPEALRAQAARLRDHLAGHPGPEPRAVARALAATRAHLDHRAVVVGSDLGELADRLDALARGRPAAGLVQGSAVTPPGRVAMLFPGQGSQRPGTGAGLSAAFPVFAHALDEVCARFDPHLDRPLRSVMAAPEGSPDAALLNRTGYTQPALFALGVALHRLLAAHGIVPDLLMGHSVGEITAAHTAGVLDLPDACALVAARGRLMQALPPGGAMAAVGAAEEEVAASLAGYAGRVAVAAVNGPSSVVVSGDADAVAEVTASWAERGARTRRLKVDRAFHSPRMDPMLDAFAHVVGATALNAPVRPVVSNLTGRLLSAEEATDPGYWVRHAREPVRFADGVRRLRSEGAGVLLELGPAGTLTVLAHDCLAADGGAVPALIPLLGTDAAEPDLVVRALAEAHVRGVGVDWTPFFAGADTADLPTYAFQRRRYWLSADAPGTASGRAPEAPPVPDAAEPDTDGPGRTPLDLVRDATAAVLGHGSPDAVDPARGFMEAGVDSLAALRLRNRLAAATGLDLATTVAFDHPNPTALARHLAELSAEAGSDGREVPGLDALEAALSSAPLDDAARERTSRRLRGLLALLERSGADRADGLPDVDGATDDELFDLLDEEFGIS
ncbi:acyltransferase domain-containing protein, partial [Actinorugispora endophytica]